MILSSYDVSNNVALYNNFKSYIDKYLQTAQNEEYIRNYSYTHIAVLKLYCAFDLIRKIYKLSLLTNDDTSLKYTIQYLINKYQIFNIGAELQKININISDIWFIFFGTTLNNDLIVFKNKHQSISRLPKLNINTNAMEEITLPINIYNGTTRNLSVFAGYENEPAPVINNEWTMFTLSIRQNGINIVNYWWNNTNTPVSGQYAATISNTPGEIIFTLTPTIEDLLSIGIYYIILFFTDVNGQSDIFEQDQVLNILA